MLPERGQCAKIALILEHAFQLWRSSDIVDTLLKTTFMDAGTFDALAVSKLK